MSKKIRLNIETDDLGKFTAMEEIDSIGTGTHEFDLAARLVLPQDTEVSGVLDVESEGEGSDNLAKSFSLSSGGTVRLGNWRLTPLTDKLKLVGQTKPRASNSIVALELEVDLLD